MENKLYISAIYDYVVEISGQTNYKQNEIYHLKDNKDALLMVISATEDRAFCLIKQNPEEYKIGTEVIRAKVDTKVKTAKNYFGKIIDINGDILFPEVTKEKFEFYEQTSEIFNVNNNLMSYMPLDEQLKTGYSVIDLLIPVGKGQRELIIGDRKTGKTFIALNTIINQKDKNVKCIYVAIGQKQSEIANVYNLLKEYGADEYTIILTANSDKPYEQYLAPYIAMAHAENVSYEDDVLIVFDDLTKHANIFREIALLINKPVGKEAFPGDMFYAHARLLERSGKFHNRKSITALPIIQTVDNDITSLIASNVISITDGQIVTNSELFALNKYPAIDVNLSVSRIGGGVQNKLMNQSAKIVGKLYRSFKKQAKLLAVKYDLNDDINSLMLGGIQIEKMFNQKGVSSYDEKDIYLISRIIQWNLLNNLSDWQINQAIKFIIEYEKSNATCKKVVEDLINDTTKDPELVKNYFAFLLIKYSNKFNLQWQLPAAKEFLTTDEKLMEQIHNKIKNELKGSK
ncbi:MSC_0619 family F1-like ATPase alpha subunit [Mycoplasma sp. 21DD0573]|uniref:MSC_0619 family F1-like ATPase alpha subunit n=1 Tax=unclassified Mycoplasma TaxID=2683645 RepID=UPI002B1D6A47|nr:ATP F0F1 synthase subunit alpha [Mycoplasma sp. 21DD0573]MEA4276190.1 ATP F0F1 synthase subunit alpha [Mycoplasma sp. 21DD0573]